MDNETRLSWRLVARWAGQAITALAFAFLGYALYRQWGQISGWRPDLQQLVLVIGLAVGYAMILSLLALNWATILITLAPKALNRSTLIRSYTDTQIAKYVPGNIVHLLGRHLYLTNLGLPHQIIARATVVELASLPAAGVLSLLGLLIFLGISSPALSAFPQDVGLLVLGTLAVLAATAAVWRWFVGASYLVASLVTLRAIGFMIGQGLFFAALLWAIAGNFSPEAVPAAILAWLVGFLTPGAPGGVAVREAALLGLLASIAPEQAVLIAALLFRGATILGDLILYLAAKKLVVRAPRRP